MSFQSRGASCVSFHVTVQNSDNETLFNQMFKVDVQNAGSMLKTVQAAYDVIKADVHAPTALLDVGRAMLGVSDHSANKRRSTESVMMPLGDCALVCAQGVDVSGYGWRGMRHEGVLEVQCDGVHFRTAVRGVHLQCAPDTETMHVRAPTGIPTIKQTPKDAKAVFNSHDLQLRVAAWALPNTDTGMPKQIHHFLSVNRVLQPLQNVMQQSFGRATLNNFQVPHSTSHRDTRQWTKAEHLAAATNVLGPVSGLDTTKRHTLNFMVWRTAVRVGESPCEFYSLVL